MPSPRSNLHEGHIRRIALAIGVLTPARDGAIGSSSDGVGTTSSDLNKRPRRRVALPLIVVAPTHHRAIKTEGEGVFLPGGHCCEQSIRGVKNAVGVGSPAHQRAGFLTKNNREGDRQYNRREDHGFEYENQKADTQETACPMAARSPRQRKTAAQRTAVQFGLVGGRPNQGQVGHKSAMA